MAVQLSLIDARLAFGDQPLLDGAAFALEDGERIGLIGRNGTGKSSLLKVLDRSLALDDGRLVQRDGLSIVSVEQEPVLPEADTLQDALMLRGGLHELIAHDERTGWQRVADLAAWLQRFGLDGQADPAALSGGQRKRAALALAFALKPDLLMLDEPTNHLDIEAIERLEAFLRAGPTAVVVTHDRRFLDAVVTRIVELDRGVLRSYPGDFSRYEATRSDELAAEDTARRRFDRFWAQEEVWIRKGVEARRTRNEGRVRRLEQLRRDRAERRDRTGALNLRVDAGGRSGRLVAELDGVSRRFGDRVILNALDFTLMRGDRVGLIGPNGAGKTTLIRTLLGELPPDEGHVRLGTNLQVAYFDQMRDQLDPDATVADTISPGSDTIEIDGQRRHLVSYLGDFLFSARQAGSPVRTLSGGERNRLLLARLFARPANLLVLDEPTNDLDLASVELLEAMLQGYAGTVILVSHDRAFLDNIVTSVLVAQPGGRWLELVGGYSDWAAWRDGQRGGQGAGAAEGREGGPAALPGAGHGSGTLMAAGATAGATAAGTTAAGTTAAGVTAAGVAAASVTTAGVTTAGVTTAGVTTAGEIPAGAVTSGARPAGTSTVAAAPRGRRLNNRETNELDKLPARIEALEAEQAALQAAMADPAYFRLGPQRLRDDRARADAIAPEIDALMQRWEALLALQEASGRA